VTDIRFEARLARVVREYADTALLPIDAVAIAEASVLAGRRDERRWALPPLPRAWALIALAALIAAILAASFFVGSRRSNEIVQPSSSTTPSPSPATAPPVSSSDAAGSGTWLADVPASLAFDGRQPARMAVRGIFPTSSSGSVVFFEPEHILIARNSHSPPSVGNP